MNTRPRAVTGHLPRLLTWARFDEHAPPPRRLVEPACVAVGDPVHGAHLKVESAALAVKQVRTQPVVLVKLRAPWHLRRQVQLVGMSGFGRFPGSNLGLTWARATIWTQHMR